jgi:hypothetical protein
MGVDRLEEIRGQFAERKPEPPFFPVVGFCGKKRHGKNTAAAALEPQYAVVGLADELKIAALDLDPIILWASGTGRRLRDLVERHGWEEAKKVPEVRRILQVLGTEVIRARDPEFWLRALDRRLPFLGAVAVADVRFDNEAQWVHAHGGVVIEVVRPDLPDDGDTHASEIGLSTHLIDATVLNTGPVEFLHKRVKATLTTLTADHKTKEIRG